MKHIKLFEDFNKESEKIYRNTHIKWLLEFLKKGETDRSKENRFISFSFEPDSGGQDDFGDIHIEFDSNEVFKQGAIAVEYNEYFFEQNPDISAYVTGCKSEDEYYQDHNYKDKEDFEANGHEDMDTLMWSTVIEDYEGEAEIVIKKLEYIPGMITKVILDKPINKKDVKFIESFGIPVETK
jgi:hypothetical protein